MVGGDGGGGCGGSVGVGGVAGDVYVSPHWKCGFFCTVATGSAESSGPVGCLVEAHFVVAVATTVVVGDIVVVIVFVARLRGVLFVFAQLRGVVVVSRL